MSAKKADTIAVETPLMKQYNQIKAKYPEALLLFRVGDFYETFGSDAIRTAEILGIVLTRRANGAASFVELAGFPHHSLDSYLPKLVKAGEKVAICDQLEDPKLAKKIVKRGVTELVTPGLSMNEQVLNSQQNNFLGSVYLSDKLSGLALLDISTAEFFVARGSFEQLGQLLHSFQPTEVVLQRQQRKTFTDQFGEGFYLSLFDDWAFGLDFARDKLGNHFKTNSLKGFGIEEWPEALIAAGAIMHYLYETHHHKLAHLRSIKRIDQGRYVWLDRFTLQNLELMAANGSQGVSLVEVMNMTVSPMGSRLMNHWISMPLKDKQEIEVRHTQLQFFLDHDPLREELIGLLKGLGDAERLVSRMAAGKINPRELSQLAPSILLMQQAKKLLSSSSLDIIQNLSEELETCQAAHDLIEKSLKKDAPASLSKGGYIARGLSTELDELRGLRTQGKDFLQHLLQEETQRTGISSLKIGFNNVFGYYLEVTHAHKEKVPESWHRKQTLTNAERYITEELKDYEQKILGAEEKILLLEQQLFAELVEKLQAHIAPLHNNAQIMARIDCLLSFAQLAIRNNYTRPRMHDGLSLQIKNGRHPVIEQQLPPGEAYVANDVFLDDQTQQIIMLTGPNMSGKSAYLRQTALICLMAQMGSFVPAKSAELGIVDKVFTRVGASDSISTGESTFMVEMNETSSILNNLSDRSLILLDEIGRGTSTYDGISIAWSIAEYLHEHKHYRPKVLFATHYHELNDMAGSFRRIKNYHVAVKEIDDRIVFLRKVKKGGSEHSFGIHVAEMSGMPRRVTERARQLLKVLEKNRGEEDRLQLISKEEAATQLSFIQLDDPLLHQIKNDILELEIDTLTPVEALMKLHEIKKLLGG